MTNRAIKVLVQRPPSPAPKSITQHQLQHYIGVCLFGPDYIPAELETPLEELEEEEELDFEMQTGGDILKVLGEDEIEELLKVLETDLPSSSVIYNWIKKQVAWAKKLPHTTVRIMCPDGDWSDGTVISTVEGLAGDGIVFGSCYTMAKDGSKLKKALLETKLIPWSKFSHFSGVIARHIPICVEAMRQVGLTLYENLYVPCHMHFLPAQEAANIELPEIPLNVRIGPLDQTHVDTVCQYWPHYSPDYRPVVEAMIALNPSCGVFVKKEDGTEDLAAMILQSEYGGLGLLQTVPQYRRRGFALLALKHQTKALGQAGVNVHCHVIVNNFRSLELFKKSGLKIVEITNWVCAVVNKEAQHITSTK